MPLVSTEVAIPFSTLKQRVITNCNNLPPQHPHYSSVGTYINEAKDEIMTLMVSPRGKKLLDFMPRLRNWRWFDVTIAAQDYLPLPSNMLTLESATYTKSTATYSPGAVTEYPVFEQPDPVLFGQLSKASTGWPVFYRRAAASVEVWPCPSTNFLTQIVLRGTRKEADLVNPSDTYLMDVKLQNFVVELATAITMEKMGWEEAAARRASFENRMAKYTNVTAEEGTRTVITTSIAGMPR